jgi:hypothetical protein
MSITFGDTEETEKFHIRHDLLALARHRTQEPERYSYCISVEEVQLNPASSSTSGIADNHAFPIRSKSSTYTTGLPDNLRRKD